MYGIMYNVPYSIHYELDAHALHAGSSETPPPGTALCPNLNHPTVKPFDGRLLQANRRTFLPSTPGLGVLTPAGLCGEGEENQGVGYKWHLSSM